MAAIDGAPFRNQLFFPQRRPAACARRARCIATFHGPCHQGPAPQSDWNTLTIRREAAGRRNNAIPGLRFPRRTLTVRRSVLERRSARLAHLLRALVDDVKVTGRDEMSARSMVARQKSTDRLMRNTPTLTPRRRSAVAWPTIRCAVTAANVANARHVVWP
jgi:hypothetical protein